MSEKQNTDVRSLVYFRRNDIADGQYTTKTMAATLGVTQKYVRQQMIAKNGAPSYFIGKQKYINGADFRIWIENNYMPSDDDTSEVHTGTQNRSTSKQIKQNIYRKRNWLLDMKYTISEIADELKTDKDYIRYKMIQRQGAPTHTDEGNHIWVYGLELKTWIENNYSPEKLNPKKDKSMEENEFYCLKCNCRIVPESYTIIVGIKASYKQAICPVCGTKVNRYLPKGAEND